MTSSGKAVTVETVHSQQLIDGNAKAVSKKTSGFIGFANGAKDAEDASHLREYDQLLIRRYLQKH